MISGYTRMRELVLGTIKVLAAANNLKVILTL